MEKLKIGLQMTLIKRFDSYGWQTICVDGHNIEEMVEILENIKGYDSPVVLHAITKKGKGLDYAEDDPIKYHGVKERKKIVLIKAFKILFIRMFLVTFYVI